MDNKVFSIEEKQEKIQKAVQDQIKGLLDLHIDEIYKTAMEFSTDEKKFNVSIKIALDFNGLDAIMESSITIPAIAVKDLTTPLHINFRGTDLI